jgi:hypothetical protein
MAVTAADMLKQGKAKKQKLGRANPGEQSSIRHGIPRDFLFYDGLK